jgi:cytochrome c556
MKSLVAFSALALLATVAVARPLSKDAALKVMHERHEGMEAIGKANKVLRRELTADAPNIAEVRGAANTIGNLAGKASKWFPEGTGPDVGKTGAKPEIWKQPADFNARLRDFQGAARTLQLAAAKGDGAGAKAGYASLGKTCKACHDDYRTDMHH